MMSAPDAKTTIDLYEFTSTQDWFSFNKHAWQNLFHLVLSKVPRVLEIGSWEGRSAVFLLTTLCATGGELVCIDHFDLMRTAEGRERHRKLTHNLALTGRPARVPPQFSVPALYTLLREEMNKDQDAGFDWIYIDGSHRSDDTLLDAELAWRVACPGCIFIFDDYNWPEQPLDSLHHPRRGIDAFLAVHKAEYERLSTNPEQYQMVLQKKIPMRIGFLLEPGRDRELYDAFEYGINIALTVDSAYAVAAAVTLRSVVEHVQGRITLYIVDCGLLVEDKKKIEASLPTCSNVTLLFIALPSNSLTSDMGAVWAKVNMMKCLPVQRVLYLDADVLCPADPAFAGGYGVSFRCYYYLDPSLFQRTLLSGAHVLIVTIFLAHKLSLLERTHALYYTSYYLWPAPPKYRRPVIDHGVLATLVGLVCGR